VKHRANHLTGVLSTEDLRHTLRHPKQEEQQDYRSTPFTIASARLASLLLLILSQSLFKKSVI